MVKMNLKYIPEQMQNNIAIKSNLLQINAPAYT
jgi:hypothetical protein